MDMGNGNKGKIEFEQKNASECSDELRPESLQEKSSFRKRGFFIWLFIFFIFVIFFTAVLCFFAYINKKNFVEYSRTFISNELPFLFEQRYVSRFLNIENPEDSENTKDTGKEKTIIEKINSGDILEEASSMGKSKSKNWWLNSGGIAYIKDKEFSTNLGPLPKDFSWRKLYAKTNAKDTDKGYFPQNIFRLVLRDKFKNFSQSVYFNIEKINMSESGNRNESNGVLLLNRYQDGDNLYYVGVRVDGYGIIKKKIDGDYYTISDKKIFIGDMKYNNKKNPNLIPEHAWIGIKSEIENINNDAVKIKLYIDKEENGWELVMETIDESDKYGKAPFFEEGYAGIRTDFMDVKFKDYAAQKQ